MDHCQIDTRIMAYVQELQRSIQDNGLQNPVLVTGKEGKWHLHPGKCRVLALTGLGIDHVPAVVVHHPRNDALLDRLSDKCYQICSEEQLQAHFTGDCWCKMTHRGIRVAKQK